MLAGEMEAPLRPRQQGQKGTLLAGEAGKHTPHKRIAGPAPDRAAAK
jgi:hypothetical protein